MFGIGFWEMLMIGGLILVAVGPERLPPMIKSVSRLYRQLRRAAVDIRQSTGIDDLLRDEELKELAQMRNQKIQLMGGGLKPAAKPGVAPIGKPGAAPAVEGKPLPVEKPLSTEQAAALGKPEMAGKLAPIEGQIPYGKPMPVEGKPFGKPTLPDVGLTDQPGVLRGLTLDDRRRELPVEGVDVARVRTQLATKRAATGEAA